MSKYIDTDHLKAEIERLKGVAEYYPYDGDYLLALSELSDFLDTLPEPSSEPGLLEEALELVAEYNLQPYRDGNAWCILLGKDIQSGICGFGDTLTETYLDFLKSYKDYQHPIGELLNGLQEPEVPKEICPRCIHYGEYCYQPGGGMRYKINENGVYDCTHFNEKEQPASEDLEKEIKDYIEGCLGGLEGQEIASCARYFYDLGCRRAAVMYDEIEYNRQRAEEAELSGGLEKEIKRYWKEEMPVVTESDLNDIARHFAE